MQGKKEKNKKLNIKVTYEHELLNPFYAANDLEIAEDEPVSTDTLKSWVILKDDMFTDADNKAENGGESNVNEAEHGVEASALVTENIVGACTLAFREGEYIIDGIALAPGSRGSGAGTALLETAEKEVRARGGERVYLVARAPEFFRTNSYETIARSDAPEFFECFGCDQYNRSCFPEVMKHVL